MGNIFTGVKMDDKYFTSQMSACPFFFTALSIFLKFTVKYIKQLRRFFGPFIFRTFLCCVVSFYSFPHSISLPLFEQSSCPSDNKQTCTGMIHDTWKVVTPNSPVKN